MDFGDTPEKLKGDYLDMYEAIKGIQSEMISTTRFDENSGLITACLGGSDTIRVSKIKEEEISYIRTRVYNRKAIRWNRMSDVIGYWTKEIIHILITLFMM